MKLYVLGNGFDLAHGLPTSYSHYRKFIQDNLAKYNDWGIVLDYYPTDHDFWSDAERNVCAISPSHFRSLKSLFNTALLDNLLANIHQSFEKFILFADGDISNREKRFSFEDESLFLTFNYTMVLETLYGIDRQKIIHLHNSAEDAEIKTVFPLAGDDCILGHSGDPNDYPFYSDYYIGEDKEYMRFMRETRKDAGAIIKNIIWITNY